MSAIGGHHGPQARTDEWLTPPELLAALGPFALDPCAPMVRPWDTAARHFTRADNGLQLPWTGRVFLNAPYSTVARWMARMAAHNHGTALVFARVETAWWFASVWPVASALLFIAGRLNFHLSDGRRSGRNAGGPSVLVAYGIDDADRLEASGIDGAFVPLAGGQLIAVYRPASSVTWAELLAAVAGRQGGTLTLAAAYVLVDRHPKAAANRNWQAKVRQVLQGARFERVAPATYRLRGVA